MGSSGASHAGTYAAYASGEFGDNALTSGESTVPRQLALVQTPSYLGNVRLSYFTAKKTESITQLRMQSGTTAAGATPTLVRWGICGGVDTGTLTLLAAIANDTTIFAAASTEYLRSLTSTFNKVKGTRYAFALVVVSGAAAPTVPGINLGGGGLTTANARAPRLVASAAGTDLPATITEASLSNSGAGMPYAEMIP